MSIQLKKYALSLPLISFLFFISACKNDENTVEATGMGTNFQNALFALVSPYPLYTLSGNLNLNYTQSCGTVTPSASGTGTGTGTSTGPVVYNVAAYYQIDAGASPFTANFPLISGVINTRFKYDSRNSKFTLSPASTNFTTCKTIDYITCNSTGTFTCDTVDNIKCGAAESFTFTSQNTYQATNPANLPAYSVVFQAYSGSIDWSSGFTLSPDNSQVDFANLEFNFIARDNSAFQGRLTCRRPSY